MRPRFGGGSVDLRPEDIVRLEEDRVVLLDQRRLPEEEVELSCRSATDVAEAIRAMAVRGAPAIGIAAAYSYALAASQGEDVEAAAAALLASRPTAVNLSWALAEVRDAPDPRGRARELQRDEVARCRRMSEYAADLLAPGASALTHCNTGGLATGGYGTAVGALRTAYARGLLRQVFVDETRPLLQGSRLTAWELERAGIPHAVIADAAAGSLMARGEVTHVLTGADRIAANGDTANKIGTYALAVLAAHHDIPLYVVAPTSTLDPATPTGADIPIEERDAAELTRRFRARNPAFDVTPAGLITAIVTEVGVHQAPYEESLPFAADVAPGPAPPDLSPSPPSVSWGAGGKGGEREGRGQYKGSTAESGARIRVENDAAAPRGGGAGLRPAGAAADQESEG
jgi:methylthioribose-1-phosphate isomerase